MEWTKPRGFASRRIYAEAKHNGFTYRVMKAERIDSVWRPSELFHAYMDGDYLGYAATPDNAKLICVLMAA